MSFIHEELTYKIIGCAFKVFTTLGAGYDEIIYHKAFAIELKKRGFEVNSKAIIPVVYRKNHLLDFEMDIIVNNLIILELKAVQSGFLPIHYNQIISYLKATKKRLGYLFNFGLHEVVWDRIIFDEKEKKSIENYDEIKNISGIYRQKLIKIRKGIFNAYEELGLGYKCKVYHEALKVELSYAGLKIKEAVNVSVEYDGIYLKDFEIKYWRLDNQFLLAILAGSDDIRVCDIASMRSYLRKLNLDIGIIVFWGKDELRILGVGKWRRQGVY